MTLDSYVPEGQEAKRALIDQLAVILPPFSLGEAQVPAPDAKVAREGLARLDKALAAVKPDAAFAAVAMRLREALAAFQARRGRSDPAVSRLADQLVGDLPQTLATLRAALTPDTVTRDSLPDDLRARYVNPKTGQARVEVFSSLDLNQADNLRRFVDDVQRVAPRASGASVVMVATGRAVAEAFRVSSVLAVIGIFALLFLVLRDVKRVLLVFVPLVLAAALTTATMKLCGMTFNLGNVIVLPLLIGLGVAFGIYFVLRWAEGVPIQAVLRTSMPDAVLLSGLATMVSFGSMAVSANPAMATLGRTLSVALFYVLLCVLVVLPAVLSLVGGRKRAGHPPDLLPADHNGD